MGSSRGKGLLPTPDFGDGRHLMTSGPYEGHWFLPEDLVANMDGKLGWWREIGNFAVLNFMRLPEISGRDPREYEATALYGKFEDGLGYVVLPEWMD